MADGSFLHISFNFHGQPKVDELLPAFNKALDWVRYAPNCWIVWTTVDTERWYNRLKPLIGADDQMLIIGIDKDVRNGWLPKWVWEWLDKDRSVGAPKAPAPDA
jgi:hypothetical protein